MFGSKARCCCQAAATRVARLCNNSHGSKQAPAATQTRPTQQRGRRVCVALHKESTCVFPVAPVSAIVSTCRWWLRAVESFWSKGSNVQGKATNPRQDHAGLVPLWTRSSTTSLCTIASCQSRRTTSASHEARCAWPVSKALFDSSVRGFKGALRDQGKLGTRGAHVQREA